jgi:L,D-peptidoglycan transpeptidase YkuD (ErfK/YbiS/YcfS/YnhG family)
VAVVKNKKITKFLIIISLLTFSIADQAFASNILVTFKDGKCRATVAGDIYQCSLGKNGLSDDKHEGDGTTPRGEFELRKIYYRADRISKNILKKVSLPVQKIMPTDGWSDDPKDKRYNTLVDLNNFDPALSHEELYRKNDTYNIIITVGYNDDPIVPGKGSAVFVRVAEPNYPGTAGGIAFSEKDLLKILPELNANSKLIVQ